MIDDRACENYRKKKNNYKEWLVFVLICYYNVFNSLPYSPVKSPWGKTSWMISDDVSNLAIKRMMFLVCRSGQSIWSALKILCPSVLGERVHKVYFGWGYKVYGYIWCYGWNLGSGFQRAVESRVGWLVGGIRLRWRFWLRDRTYTSGWWDHKCGGCLVG